MSYPAPTAEYVEKSKQFPEKKVWEVFEGYTEDIVDARFFEFYMKEAIEFAERMNAPLYCGEYGVIDLATPEDTVKWYKAIHEAFVKMGICRCSWSYKKMDFGLSDERLDNVRNELISYL